MQLADMGHWTAGRYKYLNGGPGAPGWVYVAKRHQAAAQQPLSGWFGHAAPFDFERNFRPAEGVRSQLCGTPPILSMIALEVGVDLACQVQSSEPSEASLPMMAQPCWC